MFTTMTQFREVLKNAKYLGNGFFAANNKEVHVFWSDQKWCFVGYVNNDTTSFKNIQEAAQFLGV